MTTNSLTDILSYYSFPQVASFLKSRPERALFKGLTGSADAFLISSLFSSLKSTQIVFVENTKRAELLVEECRSLLGEESVVLFPSRDAVPYNMKSPFGPTVESRLRVLSELLAGKKKLIIAPAVSLLQRIPPQRQLFNKIVRLHCNDEVPIEVLSSWLINMGFHRENQVTDIGMFSIRGGIVDIYPFLTDNPVRIEFWGNSIDSIRYFDVFTQKSLDHCNGLDIVPMKEFCFSSDQVAAASIKMKEYSESGTGGDEGYIRLAHQWSVGEREGLEWFLHWFDQPGVSILDYLPADALVIWDDPVSFESRSVEAKNNYLRHLERAPAAFVPLLSPPDKLLFSDDGVREFLSCFPTLYIDTIDPPAGTVAYDVLTSEQPQLTRELTALVENIGKHVVNGYRCIIVCPNEGHVERMKELLEEAASSVDFYTGFLARGYIDHGSRVVFYSESRIVARSMPVRRGKKRSSSVPLTGFDTLSPDDIVVHDEHGIARFLGIEHVTAGELVQDCMVLLYAEGTKIYVPVDDFHKVQKYIGKDGSAPSLSRIGTASWERLKARTRESLKEMAAELISLYAKRQYLEGIRFDSDTIWQKEFEEAFIYDETPDQLRAVREIKADMESMKPMDRLVCGDVGFGKTEVAMRAAFKAVMSGYQVAVLAPTTILASQHFATFSERMADFPVRIAVMSRFVKSSRQKECVSKIRDGALDIVIGTHRILSADITFKNLGLLIIDEEQRFGVQHKEKMKHLRYKVDVLSLSATPIPRTLQLSLIGARDMSIINTPPQNRLPIETAVRPYHEELVKTAVEDELDRGGQIYFVNNRIRPLEQIKDTIEQLVPRARVVIAHGQMDEVLLERIMKEFVAGRFDVLLSTVIIENGLDIPNVNTIIINRADTMGLSQLYQLRGRVGRSSEQAYAWFLTPPFKELNDIALKRLKALEQYTELGSGFQIAMRDLEIRGAGNILGTRQHGFIEAVGFELYCRILREAIDEINGNMPPPDAFNVHLDVPLEAYIPTEYVPDGPSRVALYQELSSISDYAAIADFETSLLDRFGSYPREVTALVAIIKIKILASAISIKKVVLSRTGLLTLYFEGQDDVLKTKIGLFIKNSKYNVTVENSGPVSISFQLASADTIDQCLEIIGLFISVGKGK